ncbi:MAG: hypothetical protein KDA80_10545, partial [Planctomycetaceae bacterium]|nr:hypothetical protein [Planctomycetaceae bacterium]
MAESGNRSRREQLAEWVRRFHLCGVYTRQSRESSDEYSSGDDDVNDRIRPQDVRIADLALDGGARLICFHTDEKLIAIVVAQPPAKVRSTDMHGSVEPTRAQYHFNWDGVILNVSLNLVDSDKLMIDGKQFSLRLNRLFYWEATSRSIERRDVLRKSELHPDPHILNDHLESILPVLDRINREFGSNETNERESQGHLPGDTHDHEHVHGDSLEKHIHEIIGRHDAAYSKSVNVKELIAEGRAAVSLDGRFLGLIRDDEYLVIEGRSGHVAARQPMSRVARTWASTGAFSVRYEDNAEEATVQSPRKHLRILNASGGLLQMNAIVRVSRGDSTPGRVWSTSADRDGTISLAGLPDGEHWLLAQPYHELYHLSLPLDGESLVLHCNPTKAAATIQGDDISVKTRSVIEEHQPPRIEVDVTNRTDRPIRISELNVHLDLKIKLRQFEVLSPKWANAHETDFRVDAIEIAPDETGTLTLDWNQWSREGFWATGGTQFGLGPWPFSEPESSEHTWVRANYLHHGAIPIALPKPLPTQPAEETARVELHLTRGPLQQPLTNARVVLVE